MSWSLVITVAIRVCYTHVFIEHVDTHVLIRIQYYLSYLSIVYNSHVLVEKAASQLLQDSLIGLIYTFRSSEEQEPIMLENFTTVIKLLFLLNITSDR